MSLQGGNSGQASQAGLRQSVQNSYMANQYNNDDDDDMSNASLRAVILQMGVTISNLTARITALEGGVIGGGGDPTLPESIWAIANSAKTLALNNATEAEKLATRFKVLEDWYADEQFKAKMELLKVGYEFIINYRPVLEAAASWVWTKILKSPVGKLFNVTPYQALDTMADLADQAGPAERAAYDVAAQRFREETKEIAVDAGEDIFDHVIREEQKVIENAVHEAVDQAVDVAVEQVVDQAVDAAVDAGVQAAVDAAVDQAIDASVQAAMQAAIQANLAGSMADAIQAAIAAAGVAAAGGAVASTGVTSLGMALSAGVGAIFGGSFGALAGSLSGGSPTDPLPEALADKFYTKSEVTTILLPYAKTADLPAPGSGSTNFDPLLYYTKQQIDDYEVQQINNVAVEINRLDQRIDDLPPVPSITDLTTQVNTNTSQITDLWTSLNAFKDAEAAQDVDYYTKTETNNLLDTLASNYYTKIEYDGDRQNFINYFYQKTAIDNMFSSYFTSSQISTMFSFYYDATTIDQKLVDLLQTLEDQRILDNTEEPVVITDFALLKSYLQLDPATTTTQQSEAVITAGVLAQILANYPTLTQVTSQTTTEVQTRLADYQLKPVDDVFVTTENLGIVLDAYANKSIDLVNYAPLTKLDEYLKVGTAVITYAPISIIDTYNTRFDSIESSLNAQITLNETQGTTIGDHTNSINTLISQVAAIDTSAYYTKTQTNSMLAGYQTKPAGTTVFITDVSLPLYLDPYALKTQLTDLAPLTKFAEYLKVDTASVTYATTNYVNQMFAEYSPPDLTLYMLAEDANNTFYPKPSGGAIVLTNNNYLTYIATNYYTKNEIEASLQKWTPKAYRTGFLDTVDVYADFKTWYTTVLSSTITKFSPFSVDASAVSVWPTDYAVIPNKREVETYVANAIAAVNAAAGATTYINIGYIWCPDLAATYTLPYNLGRKGAITSAKYIYSSTANYNTSVIDATWNECPNGDVWYPIITLTDLKQGSSSSFPLPLNYKWINAYSYPVLVRGSLTKTGCKIALGEIAGLLTTNFSLTIVLIASSQASTFGMDNWSGIEAISGTYS